MIRRLLAPLSLAAHEVLVAKDNSLPRTTLASPVQPIAEDDHYAEVGPQRANREEGRLRPPSREV